MIDPIVSAAFSVASKKGAYALLLASGVSRSAEIPTGWEVVGDLISRLASVTGQTCGADPIGWYRKQYHREPDYSELLADLAKSPEDRHTILRRYFEPSQEERERGVKMPQPGHKAIAQLVSNGFVRVIVTTNFDHLLEQGLQERGITPTVISTPDQAQGALPMVHTNCAIIKVNGDYLDTRIKNTSAELATYDERMNGLLDRVFDEYGLIVCGWSASWDVALCAALERCSTHRFTTYWCTRGAVDGVAQKIIDFRRAELIEIRDADSFFQELVSKVEAIEEFDKPHPLSSKVATAMLKRYLENSSSEIRIFDLLTEETEKVCSQLAAQSAFGSNELPTVETLVKRVHHYEGLTEVLLAIMVTGCFWGKGGQDTLWAKSLERVGNAIGFREGYSIWNEIRFYPALLLLYAGGLAAIANRKYSTLQALLAQPNYSGLDVDRGCPLLQKVTPQRVITEPALANGLLTADGRGRRFPVSEHLYHFLRLALRDFVPSESDYEKVFDRFEYLFSAVWAELNPALAGSWIPLGRFMRKYPMLAPFGSDETISERIGSEVEKEGQTWPPIRGGLFGGALDRFLAAKKLVDGFIATFNTWAP